MRRHGGTVLVGFVVWQPNAEGDPLRLRAALAERLPSYMVPARIVALPGLPVNANGKLDGRALDLLAENTLSEVTADGAALPSTETERALCEVFGEHFGGVVPHIDDDFFSLGLDSIIAISMVSKARRRGLTLSPRMMLTNPTIRALAATIDASADPDTDVESADYGEVKPLPMVSWLCERGNYRRFTHNVLLRLPSDVDRASIATMLQLLLDGHDALRSILTDTPGGPRLVTREPGVVSAAGLLDRVVLAGAGDDELCSAIAQSAREIGDRIDPHAGAMVRAVWLSGAESGDVLLLAAHHLTVDVVSWHIMLGDVAEASHAMNSAAAPKMLPEFTSYRRWSDTMWRRADSPEVKAQREYWAGQVRAPDPALGVRAPDPTRDTWSTLRVTRVTTPARLTGAVLSSLTGDEGVREFLLAAMAMTVASRRRARRQDPASGALVSLEGHGRADAEFGADTTNTVGSFITSFPLRLGAGAAAVDVERAERDPGAALTLFRSVITGLREIPNDGLDYGLLRHVGRVPELAAEPQIQFSYLGRLDLGGAADRPWSLVTAERYLDALPIDPEPDLPLRFAVHISSLVAATPDGSQLITNVRWSDALFAPADIDALTHLWRRSVAALAAGLAKAITR